MMRGRLRKLVGTAGILAFMILYIGAAAWAGERLPDSPWIRLVYYVAAGTLWGAPLIPLVIWMNRGR